MAELKLFRTLQLAGLKLIILSTSCLFGCTDEQGAIAALGWDVYETPSADGNSFACATCHALEDGGDEFFRPGHPLAGAPQRESFKNGQLGSFLAATNSCLQEWMRVPEPWTEDSEEFQALQELLLSVSQEEESSAPIRFTIQPPPERNFLLGGDPLSGRERFNQTCALCHGQDGVGSIRGLALEGRALDPSLVASRVRLSGEVNSTVYDNLQGGVMPFWSLERLSDQELADISAFLAMGAAIEDLDSGALSPPQDSGLSSSQESPSDPPPRLLPARRCEASHPRIGQIARFSSFAHGIAGEVEIVDDCTLRFRGFEYDGEGIDVQFYAAGVEGFERARSISGDIRRARGYAGADFDLTLPEDFYLDDLLEISVWCVPIGVSFGDGEFRFPQE
ncbi:MAG: DM13 domain-containing protein [Polyangiaceae bacterium]|nr:DM13 domain-containing protein [Polyangiaceae bacterium]